MEGIGEAKKNADTKPGESDDPVVSAGGDGSGVPVVSAVGDGSDE